MKLLFALLFAIPLSDLPLDTPYVSGVVFSASRHTFTLAGGMVAVDTSAAEVEDLSGNKVPFGTITPGSTVIALLKPNAGAANAPMTATRVVTSSTSAAVTLSGRMTGVDVAHNTFTIVGTTVKVTPQTTWYGPGLDKLPHGLADVKLDKPTVAIVQAAPSGAPPVAAKTVALYDLTPAVEDLIHGTVGSISDDAWVIDEQRFGILAGVTKIIGNPKVGDTVDVRGIFDSKFKPVATTITKTVKKE